MNAITAVLDKPIFQALGWTLIHFIWQGALIAILYVGLTVLLRRLSASVRYAAACTAMLLMFFAPVVTMLAISASTRSVQTVFNAEITRDIQESSAPAGGLQDSRAAQPQIETTPFLQTESIKRWVENALPRSIPWLLPLWFAGVLFLSLRFAGGLVLVQRLKRIEGGERVHFWQARLSLLCQRLRVSRPVRLCESALVKVPTVVGWIRPVILLPATAITGLNAEQLEALLAHELAHIKRYDYLVNLLQTAVETLFFYHPAVWWLSAQVRQEREHCCDDLAVAACGDVLIYARALTAIEHLRGCEASLAVAASGGSLLVRIQRLLRGRAPAFYGFESGLAGFMALGAVFILLAGAQAALLSRNARAAIKNVIELSPPEGASSAPAQQVIESRATPEIEHRANHKLETPPVEPSRESVGSAQESPGVETAAQETEPVGPHDFKSEMAAVGLTNLSPEQLRTFGVHGVTPQFVQAMSALVSKKLGPDDVIAMRVHGVSPSKTKEFKALGLDPLDFDHLIAFAIHDVTPKYITELQAAGCKTEPDSLISFRIHGVTPAFVEQMKSLGFPNLGGDQLIAFAIHGVTPLFVETMRSDISGKLSAEDLIAMRIHGVSADFIKELESLGFTKLGANQLIAFRIHGVTPAYIRSIQDAGYDRITVDQLTELRISGVTAGFIQMVKSRGFTDVTLHQLADLRRLNILPSAKKN